LKTKKERKNKMSDQEKQNFAKRFTETDWGWLCTVEEFNYALDNGTRGDAATIAALLLECRRLHGGVSAVEKEIISATMKERTK